MNAIAMHIPGCAGFLPRLTRSLLVAAFAIFGRDPLRYRGGPLRTDTTEVHERYDGPRDCFLVLDSSPSMSEEDWPPSRLGAAQDAAKAFARAAREQNAETRVAVIAYGKKARIHCRLTQARNLDRITEAIDDISLISRTNITAGLKAVHGLIRRKDRPIQVVVLSDGYHNWGPAPIGFANRLKANPVVEIETIGIGGSPSSVDERLLRIVASKREDGTPRYHWIGDRGTLVQHFRALGGGLTRE